MESNLNILLAGIAIIIIIIIAVYVYYLNLTNNDKSIKKNIENYADTNNINKRLTKYVILVHTGKTSQSYINLTRVRLYDTNNALITPLSVQTNSQYDLVSNYNPANLILNTNDWTKYVHSDLQKKTTTNPDFNFGTMPYFLITLNNPSYVSKIQILNRKDGYQSRANGIQIVLYNDTQEQLFNSLLTSTSGTDYFFGGLSNYNLTNEQYLTKEIIPRYEQLLLRIKKNWTDQGCWWDLGRGTNTDRVIKIMNSATDSLTWKTLDEARCFIEAEQNGANIVGLQAGFACFYGNTNVAPNNLKLANGEPNYKKYGKYTGDCPAMGVGNVNRVWTLTSSSEDQMPGWSDQGCWSYTNISSIFSNTTYPSLKECFAYANNNDFKIIGIQKSSTGTGYKFLYPVSSKLTDFEFYKTGTKMNSCNVNEALDNSNIINIWINSDKIVNFYNNSIYNKLNTKLINLSPASVGIDNSIDNLNKLESSLRNMDNIYKNITDEYKKFNSMHDNTHIPLQVINGILTNNTKLLPSDTTPNEPFEGFKNTLNQQDETPDSSTLNKNLEKFINYKALKISDFENNSIDNSTNNNWENKWANKIMDSGYFIK